MVENIFPIKLQIKILQLEGYDIRRFLSWIFKNFLVRKISSKKRLVLTLKARLVLLISFLLLFANFAVFAFITKSIPLSTFLTLTLATQPYVYLALSVLFLLPFQYFYKKVAIQKTKNKILSLKKLKVIAITGSYGKTSTKEILFQLIKGKYKVLRTPESYNTVLGISKVVDYELDKTYDYFICEMAAYHKGDIRKLCYMVPPDYGIITGIALQHLERFGNLKNIIKTKFELYDKIKNRDHIIFNLGNEEIAKEVKRRNIKNPKRYLRCSKKTFSKNGSSFDIEYQGRKERVETKLFGYANLENILGAVSLALLIGSDFKYLVEQIRNLKPYSNRSRLRNYGNSTLVDNTYSSSEAAFRETIKTAKDLKGKKALVTPGLVELGKSGVKIHKKLGEEARGVFDKIIIVGKNPRTIAFAAKLNQDVKFIKDDREEYTKNINKLKDNFDWIFLENDVTENY